MILLITCQFNPVWLTFFPEVFRINGNETVHCLTFKHLLDSVSFFSNSTVAWHFQKPLSNVNYISVKSLNSSNSQKLTLSEMKMCRKILKRIRWQVTWVCYIQNIHISTLIPHIFQFTRKPLWIKMKGKINQLLWSFLFNRTQAHLAFSKWEINHIFISLADSLNSFAFATA